jgi:hypothetical protein
MTKKIYEFVVRKEEEVDKVETKNENGKEVTITSKVKENVSRKFFIKKPTRGLFEEAELFYAVRLSEGIKAGLLTRSLLAKRYSNDGGALSDTEKEKYTESYVKLFEKQNEFQKLSSVKEKNERTKEEQEDFEKLTAEIVKLRTDIQDFEISQASLFDQTAENRARNKTILWWILNLSYMVDNDGKEICIFNDGSFDEKLALYDNFEESNDDWMKSVIKKFAFYISFWYMGRASSQEEFEKLITFENV